MNASALRPLPSEVARGRPLGGRPFQGCRSVLQEVQQILVDSIGMRVRQAMRRTRIGQQFRALNHRRRRLGGRLDGHDLVVIAVDDERRHIELG